MTCRVQDFLQPIQIICNSTARGSCNLFGCDLNVMKEGDAVIYQISSLSYANDICEWSCTYGGTSSLASGIAIYSKYILNLCFDKLWAWIPSYS